MTPAALMERILIHAQLNGVESVSAIAMMVLPSPSAPMPEVACTSSSLMAMAVVDVVAAFAGRVEAAARSPVRSAAVQPRALAIAATVS